MIKELLDGIKSRLKGVGEKPTTLPPVGGLPPAQVETQPAAPAAPATAPSTPSTEDFTALLGGGGDTEELQNKIKTLEDKTTKLESTVKETLDMTKENRDRLDSIDSNMKKFISLYELVTNQINPFVDTAQPFKKAANLPKPVESEEEPKPVREKPKHVKEEPEYVEEEPNSEDVVVSPLEDMVKPEPKPQPKRELKPEPVTEPADGSEKVMFLQSVKDGNASFVLEWITSLVSKDGNIEHNTKLLKYLWELGWITPKAYEALMQHIQALAQAGRMVAQPQRIPMTVGVPSGFSNTPPTSFSPGNVRTPFPLPPQGANADNLIPVLEWLRYLVDKIGYTEALEVLKYLVQLDWITPEAHAALLNYIDKSVQPSQLHKMQSSQVPQWQKPESRVTLTPRQIPTPGEFMRVNEYRIPIQPTEQMPVPIQPQQQEYSPQAQYQKPRRQVPVTPQPDAIIPLTELGSDIESLAIVLEWIRYMVDRAGVNGAKEIFNYYLNIGWVDEDVYQQLVKYVEGIKVSEEERVGYQPTIEDHATSLFFISKLKHMELSDKDVNSMLGK
ncbi:MAG: FlaD/FlaE family flagellar protein [Candidatus Altiarchaeota archaeon]